LISLNIFVPYFKTNNATIQSKYVVVAIQILRGSNGLFMYLVVLFSE